MDGGFIVVDGLMVNEFSHQVVPVGLLMVLVKLRSRQHYTTMARVRRIATRGRQHHAIVFLVQCLNLINRNDPTDRSTALTFRSNCSSIRLAQNDNHENNEMKKEWNQK